MPIPKEGYEGKITCPQLDRCSGANNYPLSVSDVGRLARAFLSSVASCMQERFDSKDVQEKFWLRN